MKFAICTGLLTITTALLAAESRPVSANAVTNWLVASSSFRKAGDSIGHQKFSEAKAVLSSGTTNLAAPYKNLATEYLSQLDAALKLSTNQCDPRRLQALIGLCTSLTAYEAALTLQTGTNANVSANDLKDDAMYAWRLFGSGDVRGALAEYKRRLEQEPVDFWQDYYREQIRLLEQRPAALTNAQLAIETAKLLGLPAPDSSLLQTAFVEDTLLSHYPPELRAVTSLFQIARDLQRSNAFFMSKQTRLTDDLHAGELVQALQNLFHA